VAEAMGRPERAAKVVRRLADRVEAVREQVNDLDRPTVFVMEWTNPIFNAGHWTPELVRLAGGTPLLAAEGEDSVRIEWDALREADPDVLLIACCGNGVQRTMQDLPILEGLPGWRQLRSVRAAR